MTQKEKNAQYIIRSKRKWYVRIVELFCTFLMWGYMIAVGYFFLSALFNWNNDYINVLKSAMKMTNNDIRNFVLLSLLLFGIILFFFNVWRLYNKYRFGSLNRRRYPESINDEEMLKLNLISTEDYVKLKENRVVIFERNPIKHPTEVG